VPSLGASIIASGAYREQLELDYRYCWLRDASLTVRVLLELGYWAEAENFWIGCCTPPVSPNLNSGSCMTFLASRPLGNEALTTYPDIEVRGPVPLGNAAGEGFRLTRMSLPYLIGTAVTSNREKARFYGLVIFRASGTRPSEQFLVRYII
jgi:Glycosyl hydrolases family 15